MMSILAPADYNIMNLDYLSRVAAYCGEHSADYTTSIPTPYSAVSGICIIYPHCHHTVHHGKGEKYIPALDKFYADKTINNFTVYEL